MGDAQQHEQNSSGKVSGSIDPSAGHVSPQVRTLIMGGGSANTGGKDEVNDRKLNTTKDGPNEGDTSLAAREGEKSLHPFSIPSQIVPVEHGHAKTDFAAQSGDKSAATTSHQPTQGEAS